MLSSQLQLSYISSLQLAEDRARLGVPAVWPLSLSHDCSAQIPVPVIIARELSVETASSCGRLLKDDRWCKFHQVASDPLQLESLHKCMLLRTMLMILQHFSISVHKTQVLVIVRCRQFRARGGG